MSENKISKKYIGTDQVGSVQMELENNSSFRSLNSSATPINLMKLDSSNLFQMEQHPYLPGPATAPEQAARQAEVTTAQDTADQALADAATAQGDVDALELRVDTLELDVSNIQAADILMMADIASLQGDISTISGDISALQGDVSTLQSDVSTLQSQMSTANSNISTLQSQVSTLQSDVAALEAFNYAQTRYVAKSGNDSTGDGSQHNPFLTITAAMNSIADATPSNRYAILIEEGNYTEASLALKANVFIIGTVKEGVRITGAVSMGASFTANSSFDNRSGFSMVTLLSACNFDWNAIQSAAGKLYFNEVVFGSTLNLYGYNNAIAQAQFNSCIIFGAITISGINVGVFTNNVCYSNITLTQHPNGGMATILSATGGYCSGNITATTTVSDFNRRISLFLRSFTSENLIVNGASSYADFDIASGSKNGAQALNSGNLVPMNAIVSQSIRPNVENAHYLGDFGKQFFFNFAYVHASSGTELYLTSTAASYGPDSAGRGIFIQADGYGLNSNVNGGDIELETAAVSGTGVRGQITLKSRIVQIQSQLDMNSHKIINVTDPTDPQDACTKAYVDSQISAGTDFEYYKVTLSAGDITNQYIDLPFEAIMASVMVSSQRVVLVSSPSVDADADFQQTVSGGTTRLLFQGPSATGGLEELTAGQILFINYVKA